MVANQTCAVVITFHPDEEVFKNIEKLRGQVQALVVVDNGSLPESLTLLRRASVETQFHLIENGENLGIATALNIGIRWAEHNTYPWVILFDQDSTITDAFMETMLRAYETHPHRDSLAILVPRYVDQRLGSPIPPILAKSGTLEAAMTSGSLMRISSFLQHGPLEDGLFIDAVDYEYSLRVRCNGYLISECPQAVLLHSPGTPKVHTLFGMYLFQTSNYTPIRRYYQMRNYTWIARRYWKKYPHFCLKLVISNMTNLIKILFAEDRKWEKYCYSTVGILDGLRGRMGKTNRF